MTSRSPEDTKDSPRRRRTVPFFREGEPPLYLVVEEYDDPQKEAEDLAKAKAVLEELVRVLARRMADQHHQKEIKFPAERRQSAFLERKN